MASKQNQLLFCDVNTFITASHYKINTHIMKMQNLKKEITILKKKLHQQQHINSTNFKINTQNNTSSNVPIPSSPKRAKHRYPLRNRNKKSIKNNKASKYYHIKTKKNSLKYQIKPYQCKDCDKYFSRKHHLKRHIVIHTGKKPFPCPRCTKHFNTKSNMQRHRKKCKK